MSSPPPSPLSSPPFLAETSHSCTSYPRWSSPTHLGKIERTPRHFPGPLSGSEWQTASSTSKQSPEPRPSPSQPHRDSSANLYVIYSCSGKRPLYRESYDTVLLVYNHVIRFHKKRKGNVSVQRVILARYPAKLSPCILAISCSRADGCLEPSAPAIRPAPHGLPEKKTTHQNWREPKIA